MGRDGKRRGEMKRDGSGEKGGKNREEWEERGEKRKDEFLKIIFIISSVHAS